MSKAADAFRTISEVADDLEVPKHVLRFWENRFPQIKPMKRGGGRRYYRPADLELLRGIRHLLHSEGFTIKGVQKILREQGVDAVKSAGQPGHRLVNPTPAPSAAARASDARANRRGKATRVSHPANTQAVIERIIAELTACRAILVGADSIAAAPARARSRR